MAAITGAKPLWDTFHTMTERNPKGDFSAALALAFTRGLTVVLDSLPQAASQTMFLLANFDELGQSALMIGS
eukprot:CAMPEP_0182564702 /NCGR_PEP_ID=MMETSP1324-20130603/6589_1 /TAXON_ID=236786 /ORGANISM="Florenciella sp., Strain RCC1587" /LENGTH=71 /DNA_ID=CAMNT_0024778215 /DNA_START=27 /DNA_END=238 /DNA_ORIENTATION=+